MKHLGTKTIHTDRLLLRPFTMQDSEAMYRNWANSKEVTKFLTWKPHENIEITKAILKDWITQYHKPDFYQWAIVLKDINDAIGCIGAVDKNDDIQMVHIGYCLGECWWHQGIMGEALSAIIQYFFREVNVNRIESSHDVRNPNSGKVMIKCGMKFEGIAREAGLNQDQQLCDMARYAILASDEKVGF